MFQDYNCVHLVLSTQATEDLEAHSRAISEATEVAAGMLYAIHIFVLRCSLSFSLCLSKLLFFPLSFHTQLAYKNI